MTLIGDGVARGAIAGAEDLAHAAGPDLRLDLEPVADNIREAA